MAPSTKAQIGVELEEPINPQAAEAPPVVDDRPEWLPENFTSPEEFARAYTSAQDKIREQGENQKRLEGQLAQLTEVVEQFKPYEQQQAPQNTDAIRAQLQESFENDPISTMAFLAQQYAGQMFDQRFQAMQQEQSPMQQQQQERDNQMLAMFVDQRLGETLDDWDEYKDRVGEAIIADQNLIPQNALTNPEQTLQAITRVYQVVKAEDILRQVTESGGVPQYQQQQAMKRQAQSLTGGGVRTPGETPTDLKVDELKNAVQGTSYSAWRSGA